MSSILFRWLYISWLVCLLYLVISKLILRGLRQTFHPEKSVTSYEVFLRRFKYVIKAFEDIFPGQSSRPAWHICFNYFFS